jgi:GNAT superfamily N-acetyltransferase
MVNDGEIGSDMNDSLQVKLALRTANRRRVPALALHYALRPLGYLEFTDIYCIDPTIVVPRLREEGYVIAAATEADIRYMCDVLTRDQPAHVLRERWRQGHHCFVARAHGEVVAYDWIAFSPVQEQEFRIELDSAHAFCLDAYTAPHHRGKGLHYALLGTLLEFAARSGKTEVFTAVSLYNARSWSSHVRMGWQRAFSMVYFRPYFTVSRLPWQITKSHYPVHLDWKRHAWLKPLQCGT